MTIVIFVLSINPKIKHMKLQVSNPLFFRMKSVDSQRFNHEDYTFHGTYRIEIENKHIFLKKRIKYPSIQIVKNGKEIEFPLVDELGEAINVITIPARRTIELTVSVDQNDPPFTDIGEFSYFLNYCIGHSTKPHKTLIGQSMDDVLQEI